MPKQTPDSKGGAWPQRTYLITPEGNTSEIMGLLSTLGWDVEEVFLKKKDPNPKNYVGYGLTDRLLSHIAPEDRVVIDDILTPRQKIRLESELSCLVMDKVDVILSIFKENAQSREAALQVELASLRYSIPFIRERIHRAKLGERAGWGGGGEMAFSIQYRNVKSRINRISKELETLSRRWRSYRKKRKEYGFTLCTFTGYTNVGKSSLLRRVTGKSVFIDDKLFSTLEIRTGRAQTGRKEDGYKSSRILISDTVGLISGLPPSLIASFTPTLDEIWEADRIVLVVDGSKGVNYMEKQFDTCWNMLLKNIERHLIIPVINKSDLIPSMEKRRVLLEAVREWPLLIKPIFVSARSGEGIKEMIKRIVHPMDYEVSGEDA